MFYNELEIRSRVNLKTIKNAANLADKVNFFY